MSRPVLLRLSRAFVALTVAACHKTPTSPDQGGSAPANVVFSFSPLDPAVITEITPLGNLNPPQHTLPTNHIYFYHPAENLVVTAPTGGTISDVRHQDDDSLTVQATSKVSYYFYHLLLDPGIATGGTITAGQRVGVTVASGGALDLGVFRQDATLFYVKPQRYIPMTIHADSPLKYFADSVTAQIAGKITRDGADKNGKINFDQAGTLAGNWFTEDVPVSTDSESTTYGTHVLSFARDVKDPTLVAISVGGTVTTTGAYFVQDGAPDPTGVTTASGRVAYQLYTERTRSFNRGVMVVQLIADDRIRIEVFPAGTPSTTDFTGATFTYVR